MIWIVLVFALLCILDCWWLTWSVILTGVGFLAAVMLKAAYEAR